MKHISVKRLTIYISFQSHLNDSHQQVMIQWAGEGSPVIICLMRNAIQSPSLPSTMFISKDYGSTYQNISHKFALPDGKLAIINTFYNNKIFRSRVSICVAISLVCDVRMVRLGTSFISVSNFQSRRYLLLIIVVVSLKAVIMIVRTGKCKYWWDTIF